MFEDKLQASRFELKYMINEDMALAVRQFVSSFLDPDEYGATLPNYSYPVHSLYLDSDDFVMYRNTINGDKNRYKLRLRYYNEQPDSPVFFEIKRRLNNTISKQRGGVHRRAVDGLLAGQFPSPSDLLSQSPKHLTALQNFSRLMLADQAKPKAHIFYWREAWISRADNSIRVTLDREVQIDPDPTTRMSTTMMSPVHVFGKTVILELKFTNRHPDWFRELVRVFGLMQCGAAKYVDGVTQLGGHRLQRVLGDSVNTRSIDRAARSQHEAVNV